MSDGPILGSCMRLRKTWLRGLLALVFVMPWYASLPAWADKATSRPHESQKVGTAQSPEAKVAAEQRAASLPSEPDLRLLWWGFVGFGFLFGFFLSYSIRSGSKTQDVFKSVVGVLGIGGGAGSAYFVSEVYRVPPLAAYTLGAFVGFIVYVVFAVCLVSVFTFATGSFQEWAKIMGRVILGEDFTPTPPRPGAPPAPPPVAQRPGAAPAPAPVGAPAGPPPPPN